MTTLFPNNEHRFDRMIRFALGIALLSLLAIGPIPGWGLLGLVGLVPLVTGTIGSCPIYTVLGLSTKSSSEDG